MKPAPNLVSKPLSAVSIGINNSVHLTSADSHANLWHESRPNNLPWFEGKCEVVLWRLVT